MSDELDFELLSLFDDMSTLSHMDMSSLDELIRETMSQIFDDQQPSVAQQDTITKDQSVPVNNQPNNDRKETEGVFAVPKIYTCMYCCKRFYSRSALRRHQVHHAKLQLQCQYCKRKSYNIHMLRRHYEYFHVYAKHPHVLIQA